MRVSFIKLAPTVAKVQLLVFNDVLYVMSEKHVYTILYS